MWDTQNYEKVEYDTSHVRVLRTESLPIAHNSWQRRDTVFFIVLMLIARPRKVQA